MTKDILKQIVQQMKDDGAFLVYGIAIFLIVVPILANYILEKIYD